VRLADAAYFPLRFTAYLLAVVATIGVIDLRVRREGWKPVLFEGGSVEQAHVVLLALSTIGVIVAAFRCPERARLYAVIAWMGACATFRELDYHDVYRAVPSAIRLGVATGVLAVLLVPWRTLLAEARTATQRPSAILFILGLVTTLILAELLGDRVLWRQLYGSEFAAGSRWVEEPLELAGYMLIFAGVVEEHLGLARRA